MLLKNAVAMITHPTGAIGRSIAIAFALEGAHVVVSGRESSPAILGRMADEIREQGGDLLAVRGDVARADGIADVLQAFGRIDALVNTVGIGHTAAVEAIPDAEWDDVLRVNLKHAFLCARAVLPYMKAQRAGAILNVSSGLDGSGRTGVLERTSNGALHALTKSLAIEGGPYGVRANALRSGPIQTDMSEATLPEDRSRFVESAIPLGRLGRPEDLAGAAVFLCSNLASFITGEVLGVDGGCPFLRPVAVSEGASPTVPGSRGK